MKMKKIYILPRTETVATTPQQMLCASGGIQAKISGYSTNTGGGFSQTPPYIWLAGAVCSSLLFLGTACSTNNPDQPKQQAELKPRTLIVTQKAFSHQQSAVRRLPQATITENGETETLDALWSIGDEVFYHNLSYSNDYYEDETGSYHDLFGTLRADKAERIASFTGERVWCDETNQLALIYPALDPADFTFHANLLTAEYTISVAGQNGSLATLAKDFHHIYGIASVVSVTETTANAELAEMKSLMTVCKFSFVDENAPGTPLPITSLKISIGGGAYNGTYPQKGTVSIAHNKPTPNVSVDPVWETTAAGGKPLTIITPTGTNPTEVYVALFPQPELSYTFTVTSGENTYIGTAKAFLKEGEFVPATGLKLVKQP